MDMGVSSLRDRCRNRNTLILILRWSAGVLFIWASLHKIVHPADFAQAVAGFEVVPYWLVNSVAVFLPWLEFWAGAFLIMGIMVRSNAILLTTLLSLFCWFTLLHFLKGSHINCGCFSNNMIPSITGWTISRNVVLMALTLTIVVLERRSFNLR